MKLRMSRTGQVTALGLVLLVAGVASAQKDPVKNWITPSKEDLTMTSLPGYPGAPALYLDREEITRDDLHVVQHYERIKVLTEKGKEYANVEVRYFSTRGAEFGDYANDKSVDTVSGRTIHPDGTIIPFTDKPRLKRIEKGKGLSYEARVFTLPDVEVGSILEYRYDTRIADNIFEAPSWYVQSALFTRNAHYLWYPTLHELNSEEGTVSTIHWLPILPPDAKFNRTELPGNPPQQIYELIAQNVKPIPDEDHMPPIRSFSYRVLFSYSPYRTPEEYWKNSGKRWSKGVNSFSDVNGAVRNATAAATGGASSDEDKLRKIYAFTQTLENTDFTRGRSQGEDKATGARTVNNAGDVLTNKRGNSAQIAAVFQAMARAAGFKAYAMLVPDRDNTLFLQAYMSFDQFDHKLIVVNVGGKDQFFDPGSRYSPYGKLQWNYTFDQGLRQTDAGTEFARTEGTNYLENTTSRVGDLVLSDGGAVKGTLKLTYAGAAALRWRQVLLRNDTETLQKDLKDEYEAEVPHSLELTITSVENADSYEKPLVVNVAVTGRLGQITGKRVILPADLFVSQEASEFPQPKREIAVDMKYPMRTLDAVRVKFPPALNLEASPAEAKLRLKEAAAYQMTAEAAPGAVTVRRNLLLGQVLTLPAEYADLRTFYGSLEEKDHDSTVLRMGASQASAAQPAGNQ